MEYNKEFRAKPGRQITVSSPRDVRKRQAAKGSDGALIMELQRQISDLRDQFKAGTGGMTPEKVDDEIRKAVKGAVGETEGRYKPLLAESKSREEALRINISNLSESLNEEKNIHKKDLEKALKDMESRYNNTISSLEDRLKLAEDRVAEKDGKLEELKVERNDTVKRMLEEYTRKLDELTKTISIEKLGVDDPDRPKMEEVFIDPLEADAGSDLESHVEIEDVSLAKKKNMKGKVDKLKNLMGSFADKED